VGDVEGRIRKEQPRDVPFFRNPGFWVILAGLALFIDMEHRTGFWTVGGRMKYWLEPGKKVAQGLEGWIGAACVFAGVWFYLAQSKRDPEE
jgi:hypothetical protein